MLDLEEVLALEDIKLKTFDKGTYIYIKEYESLKYYCKYITDNEYANIFATQNELEESVTELNSSFNQTSKDIRAEIYEKVGKKEFGTQLALNKDALKMAWNQISEFIQMMVINKNASFAILDENKNLLMALDKKGQHFYKEDGTVFGELGVKTIKETDDYGNEKSKNYINFSIEGEYGKTSEDGMAWGITTKSDGKFHPILYIRGFRNGPLQSDTSYGILELGSCDLLFNGINTGIIMGGIKLTAEPSGFRFQSMDMEKTFLVVQSFDTEDYIYILDKISFLKNKAGSNSFQIGNNNNYVRIIDSGDIYCSGELSTSRGIDCKGVSYLYGGATIGHNGENDYKGCHIYGDANITGSIYTTKNISADGYVFGLNISSDKRLKENIKNSKTNALNIIKQIRHKQFDMKKDNKHYNIGYIAQEMKKIDPNFVLKREKTEKTEERYYINELPIIATATKAIQEQQSMIEELQKWNKQKNEIIENLIKRIEKLERGTSNE